MLFRLRSLICFIFLIDIKVQLVLFMEQISNFRWAHDKNKIMKFCQWGLCVLLHTSYQSFRWKMSTFTLQSHTFLPAAALNREGNGKPTTPMAWEEADLVRHVWMDATLFRVQRDYRDVGHLHIVFVSFLCRITQPPINNRHCLQD